MTDQARTNDAESSEDVYSRSDKRTDKIYSAAVAIFRYSARWPPTLTIAEARHLETYGNVLGGDPANTVFDDLRLLRWRKLNVCRNGKMPSAMSGAFRLLRWPRLGARRSVRYSTTSCSYVHDGKGWMYALLYIYTAGVLARRCYEAHNLLD